MKKLLTTILLLTLTHFSLHATDKLIPFTLEDQFQNIHTYEEFLGKAFILIGGTTDNVNLRQFFIKELIERNRQSNGEKLTIVNIFDLQELSWIIF